MTPNRLALVAALLALAPFTASAAPARHAHPAPRRVASVT